MTTIRHTAKGTIVENTTRNGLEVRWIPAAIWDKLVIEHSGVYKGGWVVDEDHPDNLWLAIWVDRMSAGRPLPGKVIRRAR